MIEQKFCLHTIRPKLWKNGGGQTREIACSLPDEGYWRLSIADVTQEGPFSLFAGLSRILTVIEGSGLCLNIAGQTHNIGFLNPILFSGEDETVSILSDGSIRGFNLIFDQHAWRASAIADCPEYLQTIGTDVPALTAVYCVRGDVLIDDVECLTALEGAIYRNFVGSFSGSNDARALRIDLWASC